MRDRRSWYRTLGDVFADAVAALDRPDPVLVLQAEFEHHLVAAAVGAEPALREDLLAVVDDLDGRGPLIRVHADDDLSHACSPRSNRVESGEEGSATSS